MDASAEIRVRVVLANRAAVQDLAEATQIVLDAAAEMPWRQDLTDAAQRLTRACASLETTSRRRYGRDGNA